MSDEPYADIARVWIAAAPRAAAEAWVDRADDLGLDPRFAYWFAQRVVADALASIAVAVAIDDELAERLGSVVATAIVHEPPADVVPRLPKERAAMPSSPLDLDVDHPPDPPPDEVYLRAYLEVGDVDYEAARRRYRQSQVAVRRALARSHVTVATRRSRGQMLTTEVVVGEDDDEDADR